MSTPQLLTEKTAAEAVAKGAFAIVTFILKLSLPTAVSVGTQSGEHIAVTPQRISDFTSEVTLAQTSSEIAAEASGLIVNLARVAGLGYVVYLY